MNLILLLLAALFVAYVNGANDNPKGVATLVGSGAAGPRQGLVWAALTTFGGCVGALLLSRGLLVTFSGAGLVPEAVASDPGFLGTAGLAAAGTVGLATLLGLPVSTTHALAGGLVGAGWAWAGSELSLGHLGTKIFLPLAVSPLLAVAITVPLYRTAALTRARLGVAKETCLCLGEETVPVPVPVAALQRESGAADAAALTVESQTAGSRLVTARVGTTAECVERYRGRVLGIEAQSILDAAHYLSAGALSFARGTNDAPKIAALLLVGQAIGASQVLLAVALVMAAGGLLGARRVAETVSYEITGMNSGQGFVGNLASAGLVIGASWLGLAVSTTHVSCGALFGIGAANGRARWRTISTIAGAWILTFPLAALLGAALGWSSTLAWT